ncbi:MAG: isoprenylcysteine carboxylmethyltransferase family protein [Candidatus Lokiarchaeota archaeon]|nr:isoprenylcysteine carboxylmethyltransferase family protein [Candidatus Lokiarchaeota archaeon]
MDIVFGFGIFFFISFWTFLIYRIIVLKKMGDKALSLSTKEGLKSLLSIIGFIVILLSYTIIYIFNSLIEPSNVIFGYFWDIRNFNWIIYIGMIFSLIFLIIMWSAIITMGKSWRVGMDVNNSNKLITQGIFKISRNPIFLGLDGIVISLFIVQPNLIFLGFCLITIVSIHFQILREEEFLLNIFKEDYKNYFKETPRYILFI